MKTKSKVEKIKKEKPALYYGAVLITKGKYKGQVGYYDDDEEDDLCIVYLGTPFLSGYVTIKSSYLENTDIKHLPLEKFKQENPAVCTMMGVE